MKLTFSIGLYSAVIWMHPPNFAIDKYGDPAVLSSSNVGKFRSGRNRGDALEVRSVAVTDIDISVRCGDQNKPLGFSGPVKVFL